ncbi:hypothetical protein GGR56DRAFT_678750 [Xylariaceae sp. FL0804]|nr:hypothetical protein GGR56DRAFT_678750 [Xylariaceae sp. FL0804]
MPSPLAQADLIRETYRQAGLGLSKPSDRPQYFETHGTGTPAGDPVEAEAISTAFFSPASGFRQPERDLKLYIGSVQTVIGHAEGTAGLAALLKASHSTEILRIAEKMKIRILGVFTGQGAQWLRMGADLVLSSRKRLMLYTAVQIMLVQILRAAGVFFGAVVGHSSGEVPAAYAAGYLSTRDSIRVSYYRGLNMHWAKGPEGEGGGMMAVGTSFQDAKELTELDAFARRLGVGASNSSSSAFLSGGAEQRLLHGLPSYAWDHERSHHSKSRTSKALLTESTARRSFPGMGYVSTALEAVNQLFGGGDPIRTVEIRDLVVIGHALIVEENTGAETVFSLKDLDAKRFYSVIASLGYEYTGPFKALANLQRRVGAATGLLAIPEKTAFFDQMLVHPAALDATVQSFLAAYCFPGVTRLQGIRLPTGVDCIHFNFAHCVEQLNPGAQLPFVASVALTDEDDAQDVGGDVDLYSPCGCFILIQLQSLHTKPLSPASAAQDFHLFSEVVWQPEAPAGANLQLHGERLVIETEMFVARERVAFFYMRNLSNALPPGHARCDLARHHDWDGDTGDNISQLVARFPDSIDVQLMSAVGENLPRVFSGEINTLEPMVKDNMLNRFYIDNMGMRQYIENLAHMVARLTRRYPYMNIFEDPYANIVLGVGRPIVLEKKHVRLGFLDFARAEDANALRL